MNLLHVEHPRFPDYDQAAIGAEILQSFLPPDLMVNIHPFPFEQPDGSAYQLSVSDA